MRINVVTPSGILVDTEAAAVLFEGEDGAHGILPHHVDFVDTVVPGILEIRGLAGEQRYFAVDEGIIVKQGALVQVAVRNAIDGGGEPSGLRQAVQEQFVETGERQERADRSLRRLEADFMRRIAEYRSS